MIDIIRKYCLSKPKTTESFPFDEVTLVFKVLDKVYAICSLESQRVNVKCDPTYAIELREKFPNSVVPGFHMNKKHWNTLVLGPELSDEMVFQWIDHSYDLVVTKMTKKQQAQLKNGK